MSSIILTNWTVYYSSDTGAGNGYKQIRWTGAGTPETSTNTVNELYSSLTDLFSVASQNDANDTIPIVGVTPTVYQIGAFDAGDQEPWFIDSDSLKHLTGGSIQTVNWTRDITSRTGSRGIVRIPRSGSNIVTADVGATITNTTDGDTGTLLFVETNYLWIRPTGSTASDDWNSTGTTSITCNSHTDSQTGTGVYGERLLSNIYSIGSLESNTRIHVYQGSTQLTSFWGDGHIDRLILINDGYSTGLIDYGYLSVYARQYTKLYDHFTLDVSGGGRNPVPLSTTPDSNNNSTANSGYRSFVGTGGSGTFNIGNGIYVGSTWTTATKRGILTAVNSYTLTYYLLGDLTDFSSGNAVKEYILTTGIDGDATCTAATPSDAGIATGTPATITTTFGGITRDLSNGNGSRHYSVEIDCQQLALSIVYERLKYLTEYRETGDIDASFQSRIGNNYQAIGDLYIPYDTGSIDNPFTEGETITATNFSCTLTSKHDRGTSEGFLIVRNVRGTTPVDNATLTGGTSGHTALVDLNAGADPITTITQAKSAPFGTFAGGVFFGARGVYLTDVPAADSNNYILIDSEGVTQSPPISIPITVNGVIVGDRVSVFRATDTNGTIDKTYLTSHNTNNVAGDTTFDVTTTIPSDTPSSGQLRVVDGNTEHRFRYASWSGTTFTFVTTGIPSGSIDAIGDVTGRSFRATNANLANILPGDLVRNTSDGTPGSWALVTSITLISGSTYEIVHTSLQGGTENDWDVGDNYSFNNLPVTYTNVDTAYVPYIDQTATSTSVSSSVTYVSDRYVTTQVRKKGIIPFNVNNIQLTSDGYTATAVRTTDTIVT